MNPFSRRKFLGSSLACVTVVASRLPFASGFTPTQGPKSRDQQKFLAAIASGDLATVKELLTGNQDLLNAADSDGKSGYAIAILSGHKAISDYLVRSGYQTDLHESALGLDWDRFNQLASDEGDSVSEKVNSFHPLGGSAMYAAATGGAGTDIWRVYSKCGRPNSVAVESERSPLQAALRFSDLETAELTAFTLLSNSGDPNSAAGGDASPLHIATERNSVDIVEMLIRLGADVGAVNGDGKTSEELARAAGNQTLANMLENHLKIPRTFANLRASVNRDGDRYEVPDWDRLPEQNRSDFVGYSHGRLEKVNESLQLDPRFAHSVSTTGERAVEAAAHTGNQSIAEKLLTAGAPYSLPTAVMMSDFETVKQFLEQEPKRIHERGAHDFPLLYYPIIGKCELEMLQLLLDRGAEVEEQNLIGTTALHFACMRDDVETVELLIANGADVTRVGRKFGGKRQTPLQLARDSRIVDMLKSNGAK